MLRDSGHIFIYWLVESLIYVCFYLINIYFWLINIELTTNSTIIQVLCNISIFPYKAHHNLLFPTNTRRQLKSMPGDHLNSDELTNQKHKSIKNMPLYRSYKRHVLTVWKFKQEGRVSSFTSCRNVYVEWLKFFSALCMLLNDCKSSTSMDFGVTNTFYEVHILSICVSTLVCVYICVYIH